VISTSNAPTYLDRIVPSVMRRLEERKSRLPLAELRAMAKPVARPSFAAALAAPGLSLIAEVKRASPSKGPIRPDLDVAQVVTAYQRAGASAISVLTEQDHFAGSLADLRTAAARTQLPLLLKDFVVDPYQVHEASAFGASAVLLIARLLDDSRLRRLAGLAFELGLDVLLEVHDSVELRRALAIQGAIVGVNNRDLSTFRVSLDTTLHLAGSVPQARILVGESGISEHSEIERLAAHGVDAVLVGETLLRASDIEVAVRALMEPVPQVVAKSLHQQAKEEGR
jgi:indole-3-glycerol phosphate synthase